MTNLRERFTPHNINNRDDYTVMCALRGPDSQDYMCKVLTTTVIRYFAGMPLGTGHADVRSPAMVQATWDTIPEKEQLEIGHRLWADTHFVIHAEDALHILGRSNPAAHDYACWLRSITHTYTI